MHNIKNVILIVVDALRAKNLGCYNYPINTSPNIDKFTERSILFEDAYSCCANTDPAFTSIATGLYPPAHGIINHANRIKPGETERITHIPFLAEVLKDQGFKTYGLDFLSRWHKRGFDYYMGMEKTSVPKIAKLIDFLRDLFNIHPGTKIQGLLERTLLYRFFLRMVFKRGSNPYVPADKLTDIALDILQKNPSEKKFIFLHYWDTHIPYGPPERYLNDLPDSIYYQIYKDMNRSLEDIKKTICSPLSQYFFERMCSGRKAAIDLAKAYDGEIKFIDDSLDKLLENVGEDSLLIFTADHGESITEHDIFFTHEGLYKPALHVPFILSFPGCKAGKVKGFVQPVDIMPTILNLLNLHLGIKFDGFSLSPLFDGNKEVRRKCFAINSSPLRKEVSVFDKNYKYITALSAEGNLCEYCKRPHRSYEELYNLKEDPSENSNLASSGSGELSKYREEIARFISSIETHITKQVGAKNGWSKEEEDEVKKRLKSLGYL